MHFQLVLKQENQFKNINNEFHKGNYKIGQNCQMNKIKQEQYNPILLYSPLYFKMYLVSSCMDNFLLLNDYTINLLLKD